MNGFTLVELIVVVVIIGIVSSSVVIGLNSFKINNANSGIDSLQSALDLTRFESMASPTDSVICKVEIEDKYYHAKIYKDDELYDDFRLGKSKFKLKLSTDDSSYILSDFYIKFNRADGSIKCIASDSDSSLNIESMKKINILFLGGNKSLVVSWNTGRTIIEG